MLTQLIILPLEEATCASIFDPIGMPYVICIPVQFSFTPIVKAYCKIATFRSIGTWGMRYNFPSVGSRYEFKDKERK
jgi:hypothetical protein